MKRLTHRFSARRGLAPLALGLLGSVATLATAAAAVRYQTRRTERANPPQGRFIQVDGVRLHYLERGSGSPVVLLHGTGTMIRDLELSGLVHRLSGNHRIIAFDRPGFGYSERPRDRLWTPAQQAELLAKALHRLQVEQPVLVGHSWGTLVALEMALRDPGLARALVLVSGYYYPTARADVPVLAPPALPVLGDLMRYTLSPLLGRLLWPRLTKRMFGPGEVPARFTVFPKWMALRPSQLRAAAAEFALLIPSAHNLSSRYRQLTTPLLLLHGADDRHVDAHTHSERLHRELPASELRLVPGAGHMAHYQGLDAVVRAVEDSLAATRRVTPFRVPSDRSQLNPQPRKPH